MMSVTPESHKAIWAYPLLVGLGFGGCLTIIVVAAHFSAPPELVSITSGALITSRALGATICLPVCTAIYNSQLARNIPSKIASAVLPLGLPKDSLAEFTQAISTNDEQRLEPIRGVTEDIVMAGIKSLMEAYTTSFRALYGFGMALSFLACAGTYFLSLSAFIHFCNCLHF
jgi:hypothetical protein